MTAQQLLDFANLCDDAAGKLSDQISALGPRPADPLAADSWDLSVQRLNGQINSLTRMAINESAEAVTDALAAQQDCLAKLGDATSAAERRIAGIAEAAKLLTTVSRILDVGLAILTTAHDPTNFPNLVTAISALAQDAAL